MTQNHFGCCETKGTRKNPNANQSENNFESKDGKDRSQDKSKPRGRISIQIKK